MELLESIFQIPPFGSSSRHYRGGSKVRLHLIAGLALAILISGQSAQAQGQPGPETRHRSGAPHDHRDGSRRHEDDRARDDRREPIETTALEDVIVTAQRRQETLQDAAIAITAVSGEEMVNQGVTDATLLNRVAPALFVTNGGGSNVGFFIRGVGNFTNNGYTAPAVAFNVDDVYIGRPSSTIASFLDLNRVEVLKGPQGTLYGRNATGGAVNVIPNKPNLERLEGRLDAQYGNYGSYEISGALNVPLGESVAVRLAGIKSARDGYFSDGTNSADDLALRGQLYVEFNDNFNVRWSADYSTQGGTGSGNNVDGVYTFTPLSPTATIPSRTFVASPADARASHTGLHATQALNFIRATAAAGPLNSPMIDYAYPSRDDVYFGTSLEINAEFGAVNLVIIPAYRRSELDDVFNGPPFKGALVQDEADQYSLEARLSGEAGPVQWLVGGHYFDEKVSGVNSFNQFATANFNSFVSKTEANAAFTRLTFSMTDEVRLVGGLRYTDESRSLNARVNSVNAICRRAPPACPQVPTIPVALTLADSVRQLSPSLFPTTSPINGTTVATTYPYGPFFNGQPGALFAVIPFAIGEKGGDEEVTYHLGVEYDVTPENLVYASFETGFRAGGFNTVLGRERYAPEYIDAWTLGSKNSFLGDRLRANLEVFYWKYKDQQLAALGLDSQGRNAFFTQNIGESSIKGVDLDFKLLVTEKTRLQGNVQYLDSTYDSFRYNQVDTSQPTDPANFQTPITGCPFQQVLTPSRSFNVDCSGKRALFSPEWVLGLAAEHVFEVGSLDFVASIGGRYRSDRDLGFNYLPTGKSGDDFIVDASVAIESDDHPVTALLFVRNISDEAVRGTYQSGAGNVVTTTLEPPRTYGLRISYRF